MKYKATREQTFLITPEGLVSREFLANPYEPPGGRERPKGKTKALPVQLPLGPYDALLVRVALVRHPDYDTRTAPVLHNSEDVYTIMKSATDLAHESFFVVLLNTRNKVLGIAEVARGGPTSIAIDPRAILQPALIANASSILLVHNHPSGDPTTSAEDTALTRSVQKAAVMVGLRLLDHVVVGRDGYISLADKGMID